MLGADSVAALIFEGDPRGDPWDDIVEDVMDASPRKQVEGSDADDAAAMEEAEANRFLVHRGSREKHPLRFERTSR